MTVEFFRQTEAEQNVYVYKKTQYASHNPQQCLLHICYSHGHHKQRPCTAYIIHTMSTCCFSAYAIPIILTPKGYYVSCERVIVMHELA